jgi:hypothetical protein
MALQGAFFISTQQNNGKSGQLIYKQSKTNKLTPLRSQNKSTPFHHTSFTKQFVRFLTHSNYKEPF